KYPPYIPSSIPFLGHAISFGKSPIEFLENAYEKFHHGREHLHLPAGQRTATLLFNSRNEDLNAEDVYSRLTTPVFGKGVAYDVPNPIFLEQKKMLKTGLNIARFKEHVKIIEAETREYFQRWGDSGERNLFEALSELIILTASSCLHGREIRSLLDERVAQLYADLDGGFTHAAWLLPGWLPLPSFRKRDRAHQEIKNIFFKVIQKRRKSGENTDDILQTLIDATYKDGRPLSDNEIAGMLIGLLLAGQHTSSTTSALDGVLPGQGPSCAGALLRRAEGRVWPRPAAPHLRSAERAQLAGTLSEGDPAPAPAHHDHDEDGSLPSGELHLPPPLSSIHTPIHTFPFPASAPSRRQRDTPSPSATRSASPRPSTTGCTTPGSRGWSSSPTATSTTTLPQARSLPTYRLEPVRGKAFFKPPVFLGKSSSFGLELLSWSLPSGRHRCIGENFAYVQIKTIWSTLLRMYQFDLADGYFPSINYTTMIHTPHNPVIRYKRRSE
ncbi:unnamed protein product, partial [Tetraodon nigroviridis]